MITVFLICFCIFMAIVTGRVAYNGDLVALVFCIVFTIGAITLIALVLRDWLLRPLRIPLISSLDLTTVRFHNYLDELQRNRNRPVLML